LSSGPAVCNVHDAVDSRRLTPEESRRFLESARRGWRYITDLASLLTCYTDWADGYEPPEADDDDHAEAFAHMIREIRAGFDAARDVARQAVGRISEIGCRSVTVDGMRFANAHHLCWSLMNQVRLHSDEGMIDGIWRCYHDGDSWVELGPDVAEFCVEFTARAHRAQIDDPRWSLLLAKEREALDADSRRTELIESGDHSAVQAPEDSADEVQHQSLPVAPERYDGKTWHDDDVRATYGDWRVFPYGVKYRDKRLRLGPQMTRILGWFIEAGEQGLTQRDFIEKVNAHEDYFTITDGKNKLNLVSKLKNELADFGFTIEPKRWSPGVRKVLTKAPS